MSAIAYLLDRNIQISVTQDGGLNLKGLSLLSGDTRQEVISFARQNKKQIIESLNQDTEHQSRAVRTGTNGRHKIIPGIPEDYIQAPAVWIREEKPTWTQDTCPARCKRTGKCYGIAYFDHKPGKPLDCAGEHCPWMDQTETKKSKGNNEVMATPLTKSTGNMYGFVSHTYNPVSGHCLHQCSYCYMSSMAKRFTKLDHPLRLDENKFTSLGAGKKIFVGSSTDLFAENVPSEWILRTLKHCSQYDNEYLFQTKNPVRFHEFINDFPKKTILCTTLETDDESYQSMNISKAPGIENRVAAMASIKQYKKMITIEPILKFNLDKFVQQLRIAGPDQINVGADSGKNGLPEPSKEQILSLKAQIKTFSDLISKENLDRLIS